VATSRSVAFWLAVLFAVGVAPAVFAQAAGPDSEPGVSALAEETQVHTAPVTIDGTVLFSLRGVSALPAEERAARISKKIEGVARDPSFDPANLTIADDGAITKIMAGETLILGIVDADARLEGVERRELAIVAVDRIRSAIKQYRTDRQPGAILAGALKALGDTVVLALGLAVFLWLWRRLDDKLSERLERRLKAMGVESVQTGSAERAGDALSGGLRAVRTMVFLAAVFLYSNMVLGLFPWTRPIHAKLTSWFLDPLLVMGRGVVDSIPDLIFLVILFLILRWTVGLIRLFFNAVERGSVTFAGFDPEWARPTFKIVRLLVIALGVVVAYPYIPGSSSSAFKGVSLFAGIIFSLGSSSVISNLIAGFAMTYRRAFRVGDRVQIGNVVGDVAEVRLQVTHLRTPKNEDVVIPNSMILNGEVINYSTLARSRGLILHTTVGIGYETPWRQVEAMLLMAAERVPGLLREPAPFVLQKALGDFCVTYEINVYCDQPHAMPQLYTELHRAILDVFNEYEIQIMTPAYEGDPEQAKVVPRDQWFTAPATAPAGGLKSGSE
jgi:small-conductance mechanosensitive channel